MFASLYERYIEPKYRDRAIRTVLDDNGEPEMLWAGRPSKMDAVGKGKLKAPEKALDQLVPKPGDERGGEHLADF